MGKEYHNIIWKPILLVVSDGEVVLLQLGLLLVLIFRWRSQKSDRTDESVLSEVRFYSIAVVSDF